MRARALHVQGAPNASIMMHMLMFISLLTLALLSQKPKIPMYFLVMPVSKNFCPMSVQCPRNLAAVRPKLSKAWLCPKFVQRL